MLHTVEAHKAKELLKNTWLVTGTEEERPIPHRMNVSGSLVQNPGDN
ncbi:hypothetical protein [Parapedobacter tibetensis]|nr:hypothetical protein [Parapedobacter tibetensis]